MKPSIKLPKQWRHWVQLAGLHRSRGPGSRKAWASFYLYGRNRWWRVRTDPETGAPVLQVSCPIERFDRWANSSSLWMPLPRTRDQFLMTIDSLRHVSADAP